MSFTPNITMNVKAGWHRIGADCKAAYISASPCVKLPGGRRGTGEVLNTEYLVTGLFAKSPLIIDKPGIVNINAEYFENALKVRCLVDVEKELIERSSERVEIWAKPGGDPNAFEAFTGFYKVSDDAWVCHDNERGSNSFTDMDEAKAMSQADFWANQSGVRSVSRVNGKRQGANQ